MSSVAEQQNALTGGIEPVQCFQGCIGLKHPSLSRECPDCSGNGYTISLGTLMKWGCRDCGGSSNGNSAINGSGRIPDVTLEKVFPFIDGIWRDGGGWCVKLSGNRHYIEDWSGEHPLEAACAALVKSQEIPKMITP